MRTLNLVNYLFPAAFMANTFAMTAMMIILGLSGRPDAAADFGIVHGATVALFYSFSANARNVILNPSSPISSGAVLGTRLLLLIPLGVLSLLLSTHLAEVEALLAFALVLRRCAEWIAEVHVSEMELNHETTTAGKFLALQVILFLVVVAWLLADFPFPVWIIFVWATSPSWLSLSFVLRRARIEPIVGGSWPRLLPHFGSSAIIGISVYVFRLLILLLVSKAAAGDLYTAFAIGGVLGSVFAQAIGPTLALHEARGAPPRFPPWIKVALGLTFAIGAGVFVTATIVPEWLAWTGKSDFFWVATGLSLIGGAIMVAAQQIRVRMLQHHSDKDVFGPDVLMNILIVASVPYLFNLTGRDALASLYLVSSILALIFYYSAAKSANLWSGKMRSWVGPMKSLIALLLFLPVFFHLSGTIFRETIYYFNTHGVLTRLPIPVSVLACYGGIVLLGGYARAHLSLTAIFLTFSLMLTSTVMLTDGQSGQEQAKLILLIQFVLPMFALALGQLYQEDRATKPIVAETFLWVLVVLVPAQLIATWAQGQVILSPYLYLFSVHQHLQYVPLMFVAAYLLALYSLWEMPRYQVVLMTLGAPMGIYVVASLSTLAIGALIAGVAGFATYENIRGRKTKGTSPLLALVVLAVVGYFSIPYGISTFAHKFGAVRVEALEETPLPLAAPRNVAERMTYWKFYGAEVFGSAKNAALGHATPPDRTQYPSAHNYYLDFAYNFGLIALLPLLGLVVLTLIRVYRHWGEIAASAPLLGLTAVVLFLIIVDNSFKVGMRQPYPGILTFFLWGVLLTRLYRPQLDAGGSAPGLTNPQP